MLENSNNNNEIINIIISEIKDNLGEIVVNNTSGQFFQNLLDYCCEAQVTLILRASMITQQSFVDICLDNHGSRAMQKLIRKINVTNDEQKSMILSMMKKVMLILITNMNSYYFVTELFSSLKGPAAYELITALFHEIGDHLLEIAMDKFGCCALHICLEHGHRSPQRDRVLNLIVSHALVLSQNDYGYAFYYFHIYSCTKIPHHEVMRLLRGKFAYLCMNKYACHVVEKCIMFGTKQHLESIIVELIEDPNFLQILLHQTGNYVVQTAITRCNEVIIKYEYPFLRYDRLGKHVLLCAKTEKEKYRRRIMSYWPLSL
ncbi:hypothetical protein RND81_09G166300 [Saponaria officinalis]|uniref:PUM-HD domain-containing protein n=1 Tax=Saponaria officinalis TaxID=3572 RepID=A0AAW1IMT8_SAPOF